MTEPDLDELGPIDYAVLEWPSSDPSGAVVPELVNLVDSGIIRLLDVAFVVKDENGAVGAVDYGDLGPAAEAFAEFEGASTGLLDFEDLAEAGNALENGTSALVLVWENRWAVPFALAARRSGGQLVAHGRIPTQAILAALDAVDAAN